MLAQAPLWLGGLLVLAYLCMGETSAGFGIRIAECKIWKSATTIRDALRQLLSYLTWRDTKAALLVFIRHGEPTTDVINKAIKEIEGHPNYKRTLRTSEDGERYNFVVHASGDPDREIRLAFLPLPLQDRDNPRQRRPTSAEGDRPAQKMQTVPAAGQHLDQTPRLRDHRLLNYPDISIEASGHAAVRCTTDDCRSAWYRPPHYPPDAAPSRDIGVPGPRPA